MSEDAEEATAETHFKDEVTATAIHTGSIEYKTIFAVGFTLFVVTLLLNVMAIRLVNRYRQVYE